MIEIVQEVRGVGSPYGHWIGSRHLVSASDDTQPSAYVAGNGFPWARGLSFAAAALPILQYILGFALLGDGGEITPLHYILAIAAIIPVGAEHMLADSDRTEQDKSRLSFFASFAVLILVAIVYSIGESNA